MKHRARKERGRFRFWPSVRDARPKGEEREERPREGLAERDSGTYDRAEELEGTVARLRAELAERGEVEAKLRESEAQLRLALDAVPVLISYVDANERYRFNNAGYEEWFGLPHRALVGRHVKDVVGEEAYERLAPSFRAALSGQRVSVDDRIPYKGLGPRDVHFDYVPHVAGDGRVLGFYAIVSDVTERKRFEQELIRERQFSDSLIESAQVIVLVLDLEGRIVRFNQYMADVSGYTLDEVRGKDWLSTFLPERDRERIGELLRVAVRGQDVRGNVNPIVTKTGEEREIEWWGRPLLDAAGRHIGLISVGHDITERRRLEQELLQAQKMEAVGTLAAGVAHDFNNLLMGIIGSSDIALSYLDADSRARPYIEELKRAARASASVVGQLMTFSRRRSVEPRTLDANAVITDRSQMLRRLLGEDIELRLELDPSETIVEADPGHLEQILMNLVVNARQAMVHGGSLVIATGKRALGAAESLAFGVAPGRYVAITVTDTGCGMDEATRARIFEPFFTTKEAGKGTGLGLATVYALVRQWGGHITAESAVGVGSSFTVLLPEAAARPVAGLVPERAPRAAPATVLVVEDQPLVRASVHHYLSAAGYAVLETAHGDEAVELCQRYASPIDLLISDIVLPGMQGSQVARAVRALRPGIRTLFISAHPREVLLETGRLEPHVPSLQKPFGEQELLAAVHEALAEAPLAEQPQRPRVLLVEDDAQAAMTSALLLTREGFDVSTAASGAGAWALYQREKDSIDAILADVGLPDMAGPELVRRLREERPDLPVAYLSGEPAPSGVEEAPGATAYVQKPAGIAEVAVVLRRLLKAKR